MSEQNPVSQLSLTTAPPPKRASFYDTTAHKVADKTNQVAIPKALKRIIDESQEGHLLLLQYVGEAFLRLYTKMTFDNKMLEIQENQKYSKKERDAIVEYLSSAAQVIEPDSQGRFVLPKEFADSLQQKEVVFLGSFEFIKIWPAELLQKTKKSGEQLLGAAVEDIRGVLGN